MPSDARRTDFDALFALPRRTPLRLYVRRIGELRGTLSRTRPGVVILDVGDRERFVPVAELEGYALDEPATPRVEPRRSASRPTPTVPSRRATPRASNAVPPARGGAGRLDPPPAEETITIDLGSGAGRTAEEERFLQYLIGGAPARGDDTAALLRRLLDAFLGRPSAAEAAPETTGVIRFTPRRRRGGDAAS
jgi:hypothetical protein